MLHTYYRLKSLLNHPTDWITYAQVSLFKPSPLTKAMSQSYESDKYRTLFKLAHIFPLLLKVIYENIYIFSKELSNLALLLAVYFVFVECMA